MAKKKFNVEVGGINTINSAQKMKKKDPLFSSEMKSKEAVKEVSPKIEIGKEDLLLSTEVKNREVGKSVSSKKDTIKKEVISTNVDDIARDSIDASFYSWLLDMETSVGEKKILKFLYEINKSVDEIEVSRVRVREATSLSESGYVYCISSLEKKGFLSKKLKQMNGSKRKINVFSIEVSH